MSSRDGQCGPRRRRKGCQVVEPGPLMRFAQFRGAGRSNSSSSISGCGPAHPVSHWQERAVMLTHGLGKVWFHQFSSSLTGTVTLMGCAGSLGGSVG